MDAIKFPVFSYMLSPVRLSVVCRL